MFHGQKIFVVICAGHNLWLATLCSAQIPVNELVYACSYSVELLEAKNENPSFIMYLLNQSRLKSQACRFNAIRG